MKKTFLTLAILSLIVLAAGTDALSAGRSCSERGYYTTNDAPFNVAVTFVTPSGDDKLTLEPQGTRISHKFVTSIKAEGINSAAMGCLPPCTAEISTTARPSASCGYKVIYKQNKITINPQP